jgi:hypothetical protein
VSPAAQPGAAPAGGSTFTFSPTVAASRAHRVRATRSRFSTRGPAAQRGTVLTFRLSRGGRVELVVRGADCSVLGRKQVPGHRGRNRVRFSGRLHGRPLRPGRYTIDLVVVRGSERTRFGAVAVEVVPPGSRLTKAQRSEPLSNDCLAAGNAPALPAVLVATAAAVPPAATETRSPKVALAATKRPRTGVLGVSLKPPRLPLPGLEGAPMWLGTLLFAAFALALTALAVYVVRFVRGTWNP